MDRRAFVQLGGAVLAPFSSLAGAAGKDRFYFAVIADTHVIDQFYKGPENSPLDTESIFKTRERLAAARDHINSLRPKMDLAFLVGDYFHDYPSADVDFFFQNETRIDHAKKLTDGFEMPLHAGFGNHDYWVPKMSREASHELFRRKLNLKPYYAVDHKGFKFIHLNNFLGATWETGHKKYDKNVGSLGEEQLNWFEAQLEERKPAFVFVHFPLLSIAPTEIADYGLLPLLKKHRKSIQHVISGHKHRWLEFGRTYGPQHTVIAATRFDPNAYLIVEADTKKIAHRFLNIHLVDWNTHYSKAYKG